MPPPEGAGSVARARLEPSGERAGREPDDRISADALRHGDLMVAAVVGGIAILLLGVLAAMLW